MKKLITMIAIFAITFVSAAESWTFTTTCGVVVTKMMVDNPTVQQIKDTAIAINQAECGVKPKSVTITL